MDNPRMAKSLSEYQDDIFSRLITVNLFTPICLCFALPDSSSQSRIIETLTKGLERLSASFPWLAGQVVREPVVEGGVVVSKIKALDKTCRLIVKDLTKDATVPSMDALRKAKFPSSMLDGEVLTPLTGLPTNREGDPAPVFFLQATFINGGLLLTIAGEHGAMDGQGLGQVMHLFSKACHDEAFTEEELLQGNRARDNMIPLLDAATYKPGPELDYLLKNPDPTPARPASDSPPPTLTWAYFHFSAASLSKLKTLASPPTSTPAVPYITTNDAVSAYIWQTTCRIRTTLTPNFTPATTSTFARAVDVRASLAIPATYPGNMSNHTYTTLPLHRIPETPLASLASALRLALAPSSVRHAMRSLATQVTASPGTVSYGAGLDFKRDVFFSSWAGLPCYELEFGLGLGAAEAVRRPRFMPFEGLMYLMPMRKGAGGSGVDAAVCLGVEEVEALRGKEGFGEFAEWIG